MELFALCAALVALDLAALRWGYDSRADELHSKEHDLAGYGFRWEDGRLARAAVVPVVSGRRVTGDASRPWR